MSEPLPRVRPRRTDTERGTGRPNIADIAKLANVSTSAVSYALNGRDGVADSTRARILQIAAELNWRPSSAARALMTDRAAAVGIVNVDDADRPSVAGEFMNRFLAGVQHELRRHEVVLTLHLVDDFASAQQVYRRWLGERRVDGVFVLNPIVSDPRLADLERLELPAVVIGDVRRAHPGLISSWTDDPASMDRAIEHLVGLGHRRIARIGGTPELRHVEIRRRAFARALERRGLSPDRRVGRETSLDEIAAQVRDARDPLTALVMDDVETAIGHLDGLAERGVHVPRDVSLLVWDDERKSTLVRPALTVLRRDIVEYGRRSARALMAAVDSGSVAHVLGATGELVVRGSTGPVRR